MLSPETAQVLHEIKRYLHDTCAQIEQRRNADPDNDALYLYQLGALQSVWRKVQKIEQEN